MRTIFTKTALLVALLLPMAALAAEKMAVVDPMEALLNSSAVKSRNAQLEKSIEAEGQRLRKLRDELVKIEERLQRDGMTMSKSERNKLNDEREEKGDRKSTRLNSSHVSISYTVCCLTHRHLTATLFPYTTLFRSFTEQLCG